VVWVGVTVFVGVLVWVAVFVGVLVGVWVGVGVGVTPHKQESDGPVIPVAIYGQHKAQLVLFITLKQSVIVVAELLISVIRDAGQPS
jgi:hypothetical protein